MIYRNKEYAPVSALVIRNGKHTSFGVPQFHREGGKDVQDGFINIMADGTYDFHRGDLILIKEIRGANLRNEKYFTLFAKIELIPQAEKKAEPNRNLLDENIPDDL